ncbi:MAG: hypothetical protein ABSF27_09665, partial [Candidatus Dormibacteria bacterium]
GAPASACGGVAAQVAEPNCVLPSCRLLSPATANAPAPCSVGVAETVEQIRGRKIAATGYVGIPGSGTRSGGVRSDRRPMAGSWPARPGR